MAGKKRRICETWKFYYIQISVSTNKIVLKRAKPETCTIWPFTGKKMCRPAGYSIHVSIAQIILNVKPLMITQELLSYAGFINTHGRIRTCVSLALPTQVYSHNALRGCRHSICSVHTPPQTGGLGENGFL